MKKTEKLNASLLFSADALSTIDEFRGSLSREEYVAELLSGTPAFSGDNIRHLEKVRQKRLENERLHDEAVALVGAKVVAATVTRELLAKYPALKDIDYNRKGEHLTVNFKDGRRYTVQGTGSWPVMLVRVRQLNLGALAEKNGGFTIDFGGSR